MKPFPPVTKNLTPAPESRYSSDQCVDDAVDLRSRMMRVQHEPKPGLIRRDCGEDDRIDVETGLAQCERTPHTCSLIADLHRNNGRLGRQRLEAARLQPLDKIP